MKRIISQALPPGLKRKISETTTYKRFFANRIATRAKRLDVCAIQISDLLLKARIPSLQDKVCLEVGAGWVMSHSLVFHLLGARRTIATDINPHAQPAALSKAVKGGIDSLTRDLLANFSTHDAIRERLGHLRSLPEFSFECLSDLGIDYVSPIDLAREKVSEPVDFIYSNSVLEHVPVADVPLLLENLYDMLAPGGVMIHSIHMEDHLNLSEPFNFFTVPSTDYPASEQSRRGNRMRLSRWQSHFDALPGAKHQQLNLFHRLEKPLPASIDTAIQHVDERDLRASHLSIMTQKTAEPV